MKAIIRQDILSVLKKAQEALKRNDPEAMKKTSNETIHNASIFQDQGSISVAVITYALSKLLERGIVDQKRTMTMMRILEANLSDGNEIAFNEGLHQFVAYLGRIDKKFPLYVENVTEFAHLKKACLMCKHGISIAQAASASGKTHWELQPMVARAAFSDDLAADVPVKTRLALTRRLFSK